MRHFDIESAAISALFDLIVLAQSALVCRRGEQIRTNTGTTPVLIWPLLRLSDLNTLNTCTNFYQVQCIQWFIVLSVTANVTVLTHCRML